MPDAAGLAVTIAGWRWPTRQCRRTLASILPRFSPTKFHSILCRCNLVMPGPSFTDVNDFRAILVDTA
jgi:hypothetical protein